MSNTGREFVQPLGTGRPFDRQHILNPDVAGIGGRVFLVAEAITGASERIISAMVHTPFPEGDARHIVSGERGRILGLGKAYWPFFYGVPIDLMARSGHPVGKLFEKGPSLEAHLGAIDPSLQPKKSLAVDFPHIAQGANVAIGVMKDGMLLRSDANYKVTTEKDWRLNLYRHADLSVSILEAQYDNWRTLARQLFKHGDTALVGDVLHGRTVLRSPIKVGDTVNFSPSTELGRTTGFNLELLEEVGEYGDANDTNQRYQRRYYKYRIKTDPAVIGDGSAIKYLDVGASQEGVCTVFVDSQTKQESMQAWTFRPKEGAPAAEVEKVIAAEETLHDLYEYTSEWDGNGALGVLHELAPAASERRRRIVDTVVATMVPNGQEMSGRLPLTILARNKEQLLDRAAHGQLRHIGEGKTYKTVDDFLGMIQNELMAVSQSGKARIDEITIFDPPPLLDIIASRNEGVIRDILKVVGQTS